jgi:hypothetical protein
MEHEVQRRNSSALVGRGLQQNVVLSGITPKKRKKFGDVRKLFLTMILSKYLVARNLGSNLLLHFVHLSLLPFRFFGTILRKLFGSLQATSAHLALIEVATFIQVLCGFFFFNPLFKESGYVQEKESYRRWQFR